MSKLAVILTPETVDILYTQVEDLKIKLGEFDYEVVAVLNTMPKSLNAFKDNTNLIMIGVGELSVTNKRGLARYLINKDTKFIMFLTNVKTLNKEELEKRLKYLEVEQMIGVVGDKQELIDPFEQKVLMHKLLTELLLDKEEFDKRCLDEKGDAKSVMSNKFLTSVKLWDKLGGLRAVSENAILEFCLRASALGYTILNIK